MKCNKRVSIDLILDGNLAAGTNRLLIDPKQRLAWSKNRALSINPSQYPCNVHTVSNFLFIVPNLYPATSRVCLSWMQTLLMLDLADERGSMRMGHLGSSVDGKKRTVLYRASTPSLIGDSNPPEIRGVTNEDLKWRYSVYFLPVKRQSSTYA